MRPLTIIYTTSRKTPHMRWFFTSLARQAKDEHDIQIIVVDSHFEEGDSLLGHWLTREDFTDAAGPKLRRTASTVDAFAQGFVKGIFEGRVEFPTNIKLKLTLPKPTIWQGKHRITKEGWWAKSNALNTGIILCETEWIAFVDDRSVLGPHWLEAVERAMQGNYAVCGSYEKRANLVVENGVVVGGEILGGDTRTPGCYPFDSFYGGSGALPVEWCLKVNGYSEDMCDGLGSEDSQFGTTLLNSGYPVYHDSGMRIIEDRTPGQINGALKRADKNSHLGEKAKSWDIVRCFRDKTTSQNSYDIRNVRDRVLLNREPLDSIMPSASHYDWYDNQPISEME